MLRISSFTIAVVVATLLAGCGSTSDSGESNDRVLQADGTNERIIDAYNRVVASAGAGLSYALTNPRFDDPLGDLPGWSACENNNSLWSNTNDTGRFVEVGADECILQAVKVDPGSSATISCDVSAWNPDAWSGLAISYYDSNNHFIADSSIARVPSSQFTRLTTTAVAPSNASVGLVWFYTESGGQIDNCEYNTSSNTTRRNYRKSLTVRKAPAGTRTPRGGEEGFSFNGDGSLQLYGAYSNDSHLIDGYDREGYGRGWGISVGLNDEYLHVLVNIQKSRHLNSQLGQSAPLYQDSYPATGALWDDDSMEIYLNTGNEADAGYDDNDFVRIYGYREIISYEPTSVTGVNSKLDLSNEAICGWEEYFGVSCEVRFSLEELGIAGMNVAEIGFDVHVNMDDDGGDRDASTPGVAGILLRHGGTCLLWIVR